MRIVAGALKGRRLEGPAWDGVRPTSDRLRETLFNVLGQRLDGEHVLDVYAGTGAVGIEAISRGAASATFVDSDPRAIRLITANAAHCGVSEACEIVRSAWPGRDGRLTGPFDLVFLDPPYELPDLQGALAAAADTVAPGGRLVLEHRRGRVVDETVGRLRRFRLLEAGDSALSFYSVYTESSEELA